MYNRYEYMRRKGNCPKKVLKEVPEVETSEILTEEAVTPLETTSPLETTEVEVETEITTPVETSDTEVIEPAPRKRGRKKSVNTENTSEVSPNSETAEGVDSNV